LAVRAYSEARIETGGYRKAAIYAVPVAVIERKPSKKMEKSTLFHGYTAPATITVPEKDGFICDQSTWIDRVDWNGSAMEVYFLNDSSRTFHLPYSEFLSYKSFVEAGGSAGSYYNTNLKTLDK
jgi:hypothetical protein